MAGDALNVPDSEAVEPAIAFHPPRLLRGAHLQSILGSVPPRAWLVRHRAATALAGTERVILECGEGVRLLALHTARPQRRRAGDGRRLAVLLHGWEGSAESPYVLSAATLLFEHGFDIVRLNLRDHGGTQALNRELFHSCRLPEVLGAVGALNARFPAARLYLGGFSLGANFMLRVATERTAPLEIAGVVAVSPVLDPGATLRALESGLPIYRQYFVRRWSRSLRAKQHAWPGEHDFEPLLRSADLRRMTADLVHSCTDFATLESYLDGYAVTGTRLAALRFPARILVAEDDPIIPAGDLSRLARSERLTIVHPQHGGHCGFIESLTRPSFADRYMLEQFERFQRSEPL